MNFSNFSFLESEFRILFNLGKNSPLKIRVYQLPKEVLVKAFRGEMVEQEVKENVREIGELGMVVEGVGSISFRSNTKKS